MLLGGAIVMSVGLVSAPAQATTLLDLQVGLKTLRLLETRPTGHVNMLVVFDPEKQQTKVEALAIIGLANGGIHLSDDVVVETAAVPVADLERHRDARIIFVPRGMDRSWEQLQQHATGMLTLTTDLACVGADRCVVGIVSEPTVEIYFSQAAAKTQSIQFSDAFAMLAKTVRRERP
jgi:hypothetical protein